MLFAVNIADKQEVIVANIVLARFIFTHFWCTPTRMFKRRRL